MPTVRFPVIKPEYEVAKGDAFTVPVLKEVCPHLHWTLRLFVDPEAQVHQIWYPMLENGDADQAECKFRFQSLAREWPRLFPTMCRVERAEDTDLHASLTDIGAAHYYGGWRRKFDHSAKLQGPIWVGMNVSFRSSCKVLGPSLIYSDATVGTSAVVNRSIICKGSEIDVGAQVADSIIGRNVYIGPTALLLHKPLGERLDPLREGARIVNRKKCGVIVGNGCRIGAGARIEPGTILMPKCIVPIGAYVKAGFYCPEDFH
jgi:acetyltransferase-like isoleucine patch superfamily enzyme